MCFLCQKDHKITSDIFFFLSVLTLVKYREWNNPTVMAKKRFLFFEEKGLRPRKIKSFFKA